MFAIRPASLGDDPDKINLRLIHELDDHTYSDTLRAVEISDKLRHFNKRLEAGEDDLR